MSRPAWMDRPHEFREDTDDYSMCRCGVPALTHDQIEHPEPTDSEPSS
jgi:hypothetical protein